MIVWKDYQFIFLEKYYLCFKILEPLFKKGLMIG